MGKSLHYSSDHLTISPQSQRRQLHLNLPDAKCLRENDVILAALCNLKEQCEVSRQKPQDHVLIFSIQGQAMLFVPESPRRGIPIEPRHVAILPAGHAHHYVMDSSEWKAIWVYLADSYRWRHLRQIKPLIRPSLTLHEILPAMEGFLAESLRNENRANLAVFHYAELILLYLSRELDTEETPSHRETKQRLHQLWDSVHANLSHTWTVAEMAEQIGLSPQHFYKVSARFSGCKPMEMVTRLRMQQAQEYLMNTNYMIKSIARLLGYSDAFSFSSAFKREMGLSPRHFRDKHLRIASKEQEEKENGWY